MNISTNTKALERERERERERLKHNVSMRETVVTKLLFNTEKVHNTKCHQAPTKLILIVTCYIN
jgi:hypothetical protein